jgi:signal transduction histidine kinase
MAWENVPVVLLLVVSGGMTSLFSAVFWRRRTSTTGAVPLVIIMAAAAVWSWSSAIGFWSHNPLLMILASIVEHTAIAIIPVAFIQFCLQYTEKTTRYGTISWGLLLIIPTLIAVLLIANMVLPVMMRGIPSQPDLSSPYGAGPGIVFWVFYVYGAFLVLTGGAIILQHYKSATGVFRGQLACLLVATIPPLLTYTGFVFQISPFGYLDLTPIVFIGSVVALATGIERFALFDLVPVECRAALEQIPTGIVLVDRMGRIVDMNQAATHFLGTAGRDTMGFSIHKILPSYEIPYPGQPDAAGGHRQTLRRERDDMVQYIDLQCIPLSPAVGKRKGYVILLREITDQHLTDQSLAMARKKINLLTGITRHDILNQLTIMMMHNELLRDAIKDPVFLKSLHEQEKAAATIQRQIAFTKDYEKLGENLPQWLDILKIFTKHKDDFGHDYIRYNIRIEGLEVFADPLITRIFHNLLENSLRYGEKVTSISLYHEQHPDGLTIVYQDNGIGINAEDKEKIFRRGSGKRSGFGLFFSREILSLTGITIKETGKPGTGARFEISVPWDMFRFRKENESDAGK